MLFYFIGGTYLAFMGFQLAWKELPLHPTKTDAESIGVGWLTFFFGVFLSGTSVVYGCYHWRKRAASRSKNSG
jgi:threonine/homoserine/homoserine lactone efflux protein